MYTWQKTTSSSAIFGGLALARVPHIVYFDSVVGAFDLFPSLGPADTVNHAFEFLISLSRVVKLSCSSSVCRREKKGRRVLEINNNTLAIVIFTTTL